MNSTENEFLSVVEYSCELKDSVDKKQVFEDRETGNKTSLCAESKQWQPPLVSCIGKLWCIGHVFI